MHSIFKILKIMYFIIFDYIIYEFITFKKIEQKNDKIK